MATTWVWVNLEEKSFIRLGSWWKIICWYLCCPFSPVQSKQCERFVLNNISRCITCLKDLSLGCLWSHYCLVESKLFGYPSSWCLPLATTSERWYVTMLCLCYMKRFYTPLLVILFFSALSILSTFLCYTGISRPNFLFKNICLSYGLAYRLSCIFQLSILIIIVCNAVMCNSRPTFPIKTIYL